MSAFAMELLLRVGLSSLFLITAGAVALLALSILRVRSPRVCATTYWIVLLQGLCLAHFTVAVPGPNWRRPGGAATDAQFEAPPFVNRHREVDDGADVARFAAAPSSGSPKAVRPKSTRTSEWAILLAAVWASGIVFIVVGWCRDYTEFLRQCAGVQQDTGEWNEEWQRLLQESGVRKRIPLQLSNQFGPALYWRPSGYRLIVPVQLWRRLSRSQRESVLRHELAHFQRRDLWKSLLARLIALPHWFNPVAWWAVSRIELSAEVDCDAAASQASPAATDFAGALVAIAELHCAQPTWATAAGRGSLRMRIHRVLSSQVSKESRMRLALPLIAAVAMTILNAIRIDVVAQEASSARQAEAATDADTTANAAESAPDGATSKPENAETPRHFHIGGITDPRRLPHQANQFQLFLHGPRFTDADLTHLAEFSKLTSLRLADINIDGSGLESLPNGITNLGLRGENVTDAWLENLPELPELRGVGLHGARITDQGLHELGRYPTLEYLGLHDSEIGDAGLTVLRQLPNLKHLTFRPAQVTDSGLAELAHVPNLEYLHLRIQSPGVTGAGLVHLTNLQRLQLEGPGVTDDWMQAIEPLRNIERLSLYRTNVTSDGIAALSQWTKLRHLNLAGSPISDDVVAHLKDLYLLSEIDLRGTEVTAAGKQQLMEALPDTRIISDDVEE